MRAAACKAALARPTFAYPAPDRFFSAQPGPLRFQPDSRKTE